jgi:hypothetical protein
MFKKIKQLCRNAKRINEEKMLKDILKTDSIKAQIIDLNQSQLYEKGLLADGTPTGEYAPATIEGTTNFEGKIQKGQRYDHITLKDTGDFYDSMRVVSNPEGVQIKADYEKDGEDLRREWPNITGLTMESKSEIIPEIRQRLVENVKAKLWGQGK